MPGVEFGRDLRVPLSQFARGLCGDRGGGSGLTNGHSKCGALLREAKGLLSAFCT